MGLQTDSGRETGQQPRGRPGGLGAVRAPLTAAEPATPAPGKERGGEERLGVPEVGWQDGGFLHLSLSCTPFSHSRAAHPLSRWGTAAEMERR